MSIALRTKEEKYKAAPEPWGLKASFTMDGKQSAGKYVAILVVFPSLVVKWCDGRKKNAMKNLPISLGVRAFWVVFYPYFPLLHFSLEQRKNICSTCAGAIGFRCNHVRTKKKSRRMLRSGFWKDCFNDMVPHSWFCSFCAQTLSLLVWINMVLYPGDVQRLIYLNLLANAINLSITVYN